MTRSLQKRLVSKSLSRYLLVGIMAFIVEYGSFYSMYSLIKWPLIVANSISFGLGLLTSFVLNRLWTFSHKTYSKKMAHQFGFYVTLALINLLLTNVLVELLSRGGINPLVGKPAAMLATSLWNYFLFKIIIFKHEKTIEHGVSVKSED